VGGGSDERRNADARRRADIGAHQIVEAAPARARAAQEARIARLLHTIAVQTRLHCFVYRFGDALVNNGVVRVKHKTPTHCRTQADCCLSLDHPIRLDTRIRIGLLYSLLSQHIDCLTHHCPTNQNICLLEM
jgi:hypothetical protein